MKKRFSEHPLLCFILIGLLLPAISIFIVVVDELMPQSLNENPFPYLTTPVLRGTKWGIDYLVHALLFSVLPALLPIFIKYAIWRIKRKPNVKQDDIA